HPKPPPFPTRRSSDLRRLAPSHARPPASGGPIRKYSWGNPPRDTDPRATLERKISSIAATRAPFFVAAGNPGNTASGQGTSKSIDRKSTRLNSSHLVI